MRYNLTISVLIIWCVATIYYGCNHGGADKAKSAGSKSGSDAMFYTFYVQDLNDSIARLYKSLGATSVESYVTWETCERAGEGKWDWSEWDKKVAVMKANQLKWVPFLILGPAYSIPGWFRADKEHIPCRCLEHGIDSKIESRWNPNLPKWIDRFLQAFACRYGNSGVIESVLLGIQGDFGEAIYSVWGGGWTFNIPGEYHNHAGYWCNDPYALSDFQKFVKQRYGSPENLNKTWGTNFQDFDKVDFPAREGKLERLGKQVQNGNAFDRRRWIDFNDWYRDAMTRWADWWIETTRKYFPETPVYLCTGGDSRPQYGSNFAEQARVAAKHGAGIRVTNEASDYKTNFSYTNWVAAACNHYGTYFGFEPAGEENEKGIMARIYNATTLGANQLFDYPSNVTSSVSRVKVQKEYLKYLFFNPRTRVPVALWYPNISLTINWGGYLEKSALFRDYTDFDFLDETLLGAGALDKYKILVVIHGKIMETSDSHRIADWVKRGGHLVVMGVLEFESVEGTLEPEHVLTGNAKEHYGKGKVTRINGWNDLSGALERAMSDLNIPVCDLKNDSVFSTQLTDSKWLMLNTTSHIQKVGLNSESVSRSISVHPNTIAEFDLKTPIK